MKPLISLILSLTLIMCARAQTEGYSVVIGTGTDSAETSVENDQLTVKIRSTRGIGRLELRAPKKQTRWPKTVVLSLQIKDGKPLKNLEGFTLNGEKIRIAGSLRTSGAMDCHEVKPEGKKGPTRKVPVLVEKTGKTLKVTIPGSLLEGEASVKIQWIDFYR